MERAIKFRAWNPLARFMDDFNMEDVFLTDWEVKAPWVYDHIMQYTGIKDKNGTEICEGDILIMARFDDIKVYPVVWKNGMLTVSYSTQCLTDLAGIGYFFEVIGNIYENPELVSST